MKAAQLRQALGLALFVFTFDGRKRFVPFL
jgi:hypothetical protein